MTAHASWLGSLFVEFLRKVPISRWRKQRVVELLNACGWRPRVSVRVGHHKLTFETTDKYQCQMAVGGYEIETTDRFQSVLRPGDTYVDVGAQLGYTVALAADVIGYSGRIIALEPDPGAFSRLEKPFCRRASTTPAIELLNVACSDTPGEAVLHLNPTVGWSRIQSGYVARETETVRVRKFTLDSILAERNVLSVRLLKVDVEGHEIEVLRGALDSLKSGIIDFVLIEKNTDLLEESGYFPAHLHAILRKFGYFGVTESNQWITNIEQAAKKVENLFYARTQDLLREHLKNVDPGPPPPDSRQLNIYFEEAMENPSPTVAARQLISQVRRGIVSESIVAGELLMKDYPDLTWFRGHLAHWHSSVGNHNAARRHYSIICSKEPENAAAQALLRESELRSNPEDVLENSL